MFYHIHKKIYHNNLKFTTKIKHISQNPRILYIRTKSKKMTKFATPLARKKKQNRT